MHNFHFNILICVLYINFAKLNITIIFKIIKTIKTILSIKLSLLFSKLNIWFSTGIVKIRKISTKRTIALIPWVKTNTPEPISIIIINELKLELSFFRAIAIEKTKTNIYTQRNISI